MPQSLKVNILNKLFENKTLFKIKNLPVSRIFTHFIETGKCAGVHSSKIMQVQFQTTATKNVSK